MSLSKNINKIMTLPNTISADEPEALLQKAMVYANLARKLIENED